MFDGTTKLVDDIVKNDKVMGNDSSARTVLETHNGASEMFKIIPSKGEPYVVNSEHILVFKITGKNSRGEYKSYEDEDGLVKISAKDFMASPKSFKNLMVGFRTGVDFPSKPVNIDPYILGLWLGDRTSAEPTITTADSEILEQWSAESRKRGLTIVARHQKPHVKGKVNTYQMSGKKGLLNSFTRDLRSYNLVNNKHIPDVYKTNDRDTRLKILAGIIDTDGSYSQRCKCFEYVSVSMRMASDVVYLARSLGLQAYLKPCRKKCQTGAVGTYYNVNISGNCSEIPTILPRKIAQARVINKNVLHVGVSIEPAGTGEYYGFETNGNHLFLLEDFTVVHNSTILDAVTMLCSNFTGYTQQRFSSMMFHRVRNWMHIQGDDKIKNASFSVRGTFEAVYPVWKTPYIPEGVTSPAEGYAGPVKMEYVVEFTRHKFRSRHPAFIEQRLSRYCFVARFDNELTQFQMRRSKWPLFQELFSAVTGFPIEEDIDMFHDTSDTRMRNIQDNYVLGFLLKKPKETIRHKMCSAGEKKIAKCFSTILNATIQPSIILVDNVLMHIEVGRHLAVMESLSKCFPNSQLIVACHSIPVSKCLPNRESIFDMRWIEVPGLMWREPWRLRLLDDLLEALERLSNIPMDKCSEESHKFISKGASLVRVLETDENSDNVMNLSIDWLSKFPPFLKGELFATPLPKMRWHDNRQIRN
jgi:hypothetical protein